MKHMKGLKFLLLAVIAFGAYSCFNNDVVDEDPIDYTPTREATLLTEYLDTLVKRGFDVDTADVGIYYVITKEGEGDYTQLGDSIGLEYTGFRPDNNSVFDASSYWYEDGLWNFRFNQGELIPGFTEALKLMNKGTEGLFIIPSELAYGSTGNNSIPPYTTLAFELKLIDIYE